MSERNIGSTVAVSNEVHAKVHELCKRDDLKVKAVVNAALKEYLESRLDCFHEVESETTEVLHGGFVQ
ncbi:MAG: hypothetical protein HOB51_00670 [Thaumarchaeota archaeon]|jgi:hypothetical protein|nr:hypothetical protein [Nitrososphaerota archaeon]